DNGGNYGLWKSDGTEVGTIRVKAIGFFFSEAFPVLVDVNGTLFFTGAHRFSRFELWKSDGTEAGTMLIRSNLINFSFSPVNVNGTAFFSGSDWTHTGLWKSDGTSEGTVLVKDGLTPSQLVNANGTLFFLSGSNSDTLWKSDGTSTGTVLLK